MKISLKEVFGFKENKMLTGEELVKYIQDTEKSIKAPSITASNTFDPMASKQYTDENMGELLRAIKANPDTKFEIYGEGDDYILIAAKNAATKKFGDQIGDSGKGLD